MSSTDTGERAVRYVNLLLGTAFGPGAAELGEVNVYTIKKVDPGFFRHAEEEQDFDPQRDPVYAEFKRDPDVIAAESEDQLPDEFEVADWDGGAAGWTAMKDDDRIDPRAHRQAKRRDRWYDEYGDEDVRNPVAICLKDSKTIQADGAMLPADSNWLYYKPNPRADPDIDRGSERDRDGSRFGEVHFDRVAVIGAPDSVRRDDGSGLWHYRKQYVDDAHLAELHNYVMAKEEQR